MCQPAISILPLLRYTINVQPAYYIHAHSYTEASRSVSKLRSILRCCVSVFLFFFIFRFQNTMNAFDVICFYRASKHKKKIRNNLTHSLDVSTCHLAFQRSVCGWYVCRRKKTYVVVAATDSGQRDKHGIKQIKTK